MRNWRWRREVAFEAWEGRCREEKRTQESTPPQQYAAFLGLHSSLALSLQKQLQKH